MPHKKTALIGMHRDAQICTLEGAIGANWKITPARSVNDMIEQMGIEYVSVQLLGELGIRESELHLMGIDHQMVRDAPIATPKKNFDAYIMDANLGQNGVKIFYPCQLIFAHIRVSYEAGTAKFMALTARSDMIPDIGKAGIPCMDKALGYSKIIAKYLNQ